MSFFSKAVTVALLALGFVTLDAASPGFAQQLDRNLNAAPAAAVPAVATVVTPNPLEASAAPVLSEGMPSAAPQAEATETPDYASLEDAVARQDAPESVSDALRCLAASVYYESKGEPLSGQLAVAEVILNRVKSGRFASSVCSVVTQPGQFSFVRGGHVPEVGTNAQWRTALAVAQVAMADAWDSPVTGALYFHARRVSPGWRATKIAAIGNHVFFR